MIPEDVRKLLGGYATGTLTAAEQEALLSAALEDQELFDALMKEEAIRDVLQDPASKAALLAALEQPVARPAWWHWRPLIGAVAMAGIALGAVAVWRATRENAAPVTVAQEMKRAAPPPAIVGTLQPAVRDVKIEPPAPSKPLVKRQVAPQPKAPADANSVAQASGLHLSKDQVSEVVPAAPPQAAAAPPPAPLRQQVQVAPASPMAQQQFSQSAPSVSAEAVQALNSPGSTAVSGFRADSAPKFEMAAKVMDKKAASPLEWRLLRGDREALPDTVLDPGEAIRLRIVAYAPGVVTVSEGAKVLASATVEAGRAFDTPPIPSTGPGPRQLRLTLATMDKSPPITLPIVLTYGK